VADQKAAGEENVVAWEASGKETAGAWSTVWNGKIQANKIME